MTRKIIIVGGVAGGASAAARLRRLDEEAEIIMFERDEYISFANCGLPYYIGDVITDRSKLLVQTPEAMYNRFRIDIRTRSEVIGVDTAAKAVTVRSAERGEYTESYDQLILSPGAKPLRPNLPGIQSSRIYTLRNIPDTDRVKDMVTKQQTRSAIVIGGGFIGVEMAENLRELGLNVTLIEGGSQILAPFDAEISGVLAKELEDHGVHLRMSERVQGFHEREDGIAVELSDGSLLHSDMILLAIGVVPDTDFLKSSGVAMGARGHLLVNDHMQTNFSDIYAVGDAVEVIDFINGQSAAIPLAGPANKQGRIAADNVCGLGTTYKGSQGTSIIKVFGLTGAATGNSEKTLQRLNIPYHVTCVHPQSHASYYPGATPLSLKLLFQDDGTILGAQAVGYDGVDKRIDDIATVIRLRGTISDLTELELAYAPPYSSAKDPVNMAGYTAENILTGRTRVFTAQQLSTRPVDSTMLVDVRSDLEHDSGHIPGSMLIPVDELRERLHELDPAKEIWVYCQVGLRGYTASRILQQKGFKVRNLTGGYKSYVMAIYSPGQVALPDLSDLSDLPALSAPPAPPAPQLRQESAAKPQVAATQEAAIVPIVPDAELDACGLSCPGPLLQTKNKMEQLQEGQVLRITASDPGFYTDIQAWARMGGHETLQVSKSPQGLIEAFVSKGATSSPAPVTASAEGTSMVVFSGDLDKAIASFIIANGAAASGKKVTMFFTFWGLNILRKPEKVSVSKQLIGKMFGLMMPRGSKKLALSKMNMMGMGAWMIRGVMKKNNVSSLEELMLTAQQQGVELVACQMSMDLMGITREELIDGIHIGGVGHYLGKADQSGINLFI